MREWISGGGVVYIAGRPGRMQRRMVKGQRTDILEGMGEWEEVGADRSFDEERRRLEELGDDPRFRGKLWVRKPGTGLGSRLGVASMEVLWEWRLTWAC